MKKLLLFVLAATAFAACSTDTTQDLAPEIPTAPDELQVSFDEEDTRIQLQNGTTVWSAGDLVSVFYRSDAKQKWQFQGNTGDTSGTLKRISAGTATTTTERVIALYPYSENYTLNTENYSVIASLPAEQTYLADSFGLNGTLMVSSGYYNQLSLKNVCGWLKLQLTGDAETIKSITLRGNNGEQVAGEVYINSDDASCILAAEMGVGEEGGAGGAGGTLVFDDTILTEVTLNCGEGVALQKKTATAFYIALPPQTFEKGITVEITTCDGFTLTRTTENAIIIERNHILPMQSTDLTMSKIYYTSSNGDVVTPNNVDVFGVKIISNTYANGQGVITFDGEVAMIGNNAFWGTSLASITIPNSVTSIGGYAFSDCSSLTSVTIPDNVTKIEEWTFRYCYALTSVTIGDNVTEIGHAAFHSCTSLTSVTIPESVTAIGTYAFWGCSALTSVTIPDSVTTIGNAAFACCDSLTSATIGNSVTTIENSAFESCPSLTSVTIPNSVTTIGKQAFYGCDSLQAFYGKFAPADNRCLIVDGELIAFAIGCGLTEYTIPDSVTTIARFAFHRCFSLASVTIPDSVTTIESNAFNSCLSLTSVTIPDSVTTIGDWAFNACYSLTSVTIGDSVTEIGGGAFSSCTKLKEVYCKPTTPPSLGAYSVFDNNASDRKIYVSAVSVDAYKAATYWSGYADAIEPYNFTE